MMKYISESNIYKKLSESIDKTRVYKVADIFCAIWPDFPTPIITNFPFEFITFSQRVVKDLSSWFEIDLIESDSIFNVLLADAM